MLHLARSTRQRAHCIRYISSEAANTAGKLGESGDDLVPAQNSHRHGGSINANHPGSPFTRRNQSAPTGPARGRNVQTDAEQSKAESSVPSFAARLAQRETAKASHAPGAVSRSRPFVLAPVDFNPLRPKRESEQAQRVSDETGAAGETKRDRRDNHKNLRQVETVRTPGARRDAPSNPLRLRHKVQQAKVAGKAGDGLGKVAEEVKSKRVELRNDDQDRLADQKDSTEVKTTESPDIVQRSEPRSGVVKAESPTDPSEQVQARSSPDAVLESLIDKRSTETIEAPAVTLDYRPTNLSELFGSTTSQPHSTEVQTASPPLSHWDLDYSRFLPADLSIDAGSLNAVELAQLALARRREVGKHGRSRILNIVEKAAGVESPRKNTIN